ncbi:MAG: glycoside hydrolase [Bacteroidales bacterium]|nr:glycoside hydrolase [Bacteroidales bacterium]
MKTFYRYRVIATVLLALAALTAAAGDRFAQDRARWLAIAEQCKPELNVTEVPPVSIVEAVEDPAAFQGWKYVPVASPDSLSEMNFRQMRTVTLDFGRHITGHLVLRLKTLGDVMDAPVRLKFFFGETPGEMNVPLDPWRGSLSRAWMQDETVTLYAADRDIRLERRVAFRYLRIDLMGGNFDFALDGVRCEAATSAGECRTALSPDCPQIIKDINRVSLATLAECMQTVYEDGPKRDRRLWIGDLYLESLAGRYSYQNHDLTKRCLYLFAGLTDGNGRMMADLFEEPEPHPQWGTYCLTYSLLYPSVLLEYLKDTGDVATAQDLWPVAKFQVEDALGRVRDDFTCSASRAWLFFDHQVMDLEVPFQGAMLFALSQTCELAERIGRESEVAECRALAAKIRKGVRARYYNRKSGLMESTDGSPVSVHAQIWAVIGGILSPREGRKALEAVLAREDAVRANSPYAMHYLLEAMMQCGMGEQAKAAMVDYWGGMVNKGADTFWEVYNPSDDLHSPYSFYPLNSYCHAWSCTPTYFIFKYPEIFQR